MKNYQEFQRFMAVFEEITGKPISKILQKLYWEILADYDDQVAIRALSAVAMSHRFSVPVTPAELLDQLVIPQKDFALLAWREVSDAIVRFGQYQSVIFTDSMIHSVIAAMGGWVTVTAISMAEMPYRQAEFCKYYNVLQHVDPEIIPHLPGLVEIDNRARGYSAAISPPVLIECRYLRAKQKTITDNSPQMAGNADEINDVDISDVGQGLCMGNDIIMRQR